MYNIPIGTKAGTRVLVRTKAGGCYDNKLGTVTELYSDGFAEISACPPGTPVEWYRVRFDHPADNGGRAMESDVFTRRSLFPIGYDRDYWGRPSGKPPR